MSKPPNGGQDDERPEVRAMIPARSRNEPRELRAARDAFYHLAQGDPASFPVQLCQLMAAYLDRMDGAASRTETAAARMERVPELVEKRLAAQLKPLFDRLEAQAVETRHAVAQMSRQAEDSRKAMATEMYALKNQVGSQVLEVGRYQESLRRDVPRVEQAVNQLEQFKLAVMACGALLIFAAGFLVHAFLTR